MADGSFFPMLLVFASEYMMQFSGRFLDDARQAVNEVFLYVFFFPVCNEDMRLCDIMCFRPHMM